MHVQKSQKIRLDPKNLTYRMYEWDEASENPGQRMISVTVPGTPNSMTSELELEKVLTEAEVKSLESIREKLLKATLADHGVKPVAAKSSSATATS